MKITSKTVIVLLGIASVVSVAAGMYLLMNPWNLTTQQQGLIGVTSLIIAILMAGFPKRTWAGILGLIIFGFYQLGRSSGKIEHPFFRYLVGLPLIGLGLFGLYKIIEVVFPDSEER